MTNTLMLYTGAITLGALHAFEPGHGKTLISAYMIGSRGKAWDGIALGAIVTFTHTFSVILLGLAAKFLSKSYTDTELHNWLGLVSAAIILVVGLWMLRQHLLGHSGHHHFHLFGQGHSHATHHEHSHSHETHHDHKHEHSHNHDLNGTAQTVNNKWQLLLLGISGGIIPCPAAIAVLLTAIAAGRISQGLSVTFFFSLGVGLVMMSIGLALSRVGHLTEKITENFKFAKRMGVVSAVLITSLGSYTLFNSVKNIWF